MSTSTVDKNLVALKSYDKSIVSSRFLVALIAKGTSTLKVVGILAATVDKNVNSHCLQDSSSSESYGYRMKKMADPPEREILNVVEPHFSVWRTHM